MRLSMRPSMLKRMEKPLAKRPSMLKRMDKPLAKRTERRTDAKTEKKIPFRFETPISANRRQCENPGSSSSCERVNQLWWNF
jgi:hypothetical protein